MKKKPSFSMSKELLEEFDNEITARKFHEEIPNEADRSKVVRALIRAWIDEECEVDIEISGKRNPAIPAAN